MKKIKSLLSLGGRTALITGATGHLGSIFCETLAELGADLILVDRHRDKLILKRNQLVANYYVNVEIYDVDLECENERVNLIQNILSKHTYLNVLINNAAFVGASDLDGWNEPFEKQSLVSWRRALEVNVTAPFHISQALSSIMKKSMGANIVNISSIYGSIAPDWSLYDGVDMSNPAAYAVSKAGLEQLTRWLSTTLSPDIRVNAISPGGIYRAQPDLFVERYINKVPLKRMASENDFVGVIAYLTTDMSRYVTGQVLSVDGGWGV